MNNLFSQEVLKGFAEPWKQLVQTVDDCIMDDYFENYVLSGTCTPDDRAHMNACSIVGVAPEYNHFLECHFSIGNHTDKPFWMKELRDAIPFLSSEEPDQALVNFFGGTIRAKLGNDKCHVVGMVSLHQTDTKHSFTALWMHPELGRSIVGYVMKYVLDLRLK